MTLSVDVPTTMTVITYSHIESPLGEVFVAATPDGIASSSFGATEVGFVADVERFLGAPAERLKEGLGLQPRDSTSVTREALAQLSAYFSGRLRRFDCPLDLARQTPFQQTVLRAVAAIPWGSVLCYGEVAENVGLPGAARAVGGVMRQNPLPIIVPCHRVVRAGGQ